MSKTRKHLTTIEVEVEVEYEVDGRYVPARTHGPADNWAPAEHAEVEVVAARLSLRLHNGTVRVLDILPVLPRDIERRLVDDAYEVAERDDAEASACRAEDRADARRDERRGL